MENIKDDAWHDVSVALINRFSVGEELERRENRGKEALGSSSQARCNVPSPSTQLHNITFN